MIASTQSQFRGLNRLAGFDQLWVFVLYRLWRARWFGTMSSKLDASREVTLPNAWNRRNVRPELFRCRGRSERRLAERSLSCCFAHGCRADIRAKQDRIQGATEARLVTRASHTNGGRTRAFDQRICDAETFAHVPVQICRIMKASEPRFEVTIGACLRRRGRGVP